MINLMVLGEAGGPFLVVCMLILFSIGVNKKEYH